MRCNPGSGNLLPVRVRAMLADPRAPAVLAWAPDTVTLADPRAHALLAPVGRVAHTCLCSVAAHPPSASIWDGTSCRPSSSGRRTVPRGSRPAVLTAASRGPLHLHDARSREKNFDMAPPCLATMSRFFFVLSEDPGTGNFVVRRSSCRDAVLCSSSTNILVFIQKTRVPGASAGQAQRLGRRANTPAAEALVRVAARQQPLTVPAHPRAESHRAPWFGNS